ncbi:GGDEF domain-containing protein [Neorhizobium sp. NCHU2750]|uniref:GGDEF domain-containing protein n=1 Tax=Neorhizobium sp. NCHU2750 TaxID=1825976 RepID=UPI000E726A03|nr:diguanylate cyclase [Neorhizobium sp. NCHU2750]
MRNIVAKSVMIGIMSVIASLALSFAIVPHLGGQVAGAGLIMTIVCPLVISIPASMLQLWQADRLKRARAETAQALEKLAAAYEELRQISRRDGLTGLFNRAAFLDELAALSRNGVTGGLMFLDLDHFKSINDRHGHATGDEALRRTGAVLALDAGQFDLSGRLGGEEFALFKTGVTAKELASHCEEVRLAIEAIDLRSEAGARIPLSASIGALHCRPGFDPEACLRGADEHLYEAKSRGRNQSVASL